MKHTEIRRILIKSLLVSCSWLPLSVCHLLGSLIGWVFILFPNQTARNAKTNIGLCFPEMDPSEQRVLFRRSLVETGKAILEASVLWIRPGEKALQLIRRVNGLDVVIKARNDGYGLILATPHLGAWEAAGLYCGATFGMTCLYRPLRMTELESLVHAGRSRLGAKYVPISTRGIRAISMAVVKGETVAILPDQEPRGGSGHFAPFFGIPAYSMSLLVRLSKKTGAPVVFTYCERLPLGRGYHLHFRRAPQELHSLDTYDAVCVMNRAVEGLIRECPAQYQWGYRRFGTRPEGDRPVYH